MSSDDLPGLNNLKKEADNGGDPYTHNKIPSFWVTFQLCIASDHQQGEDSIEKRMPEFIIR